jgi:hypothetical protein
MKNNSTFKKIIGLIVTIITVVGFYLFGKALGMNVVAEFAPYIATLAIGWVIYLVQKWFGIKLDFLNNDFTKQKVIESIFWAEGKAIEKFKIDAVVSEGKKKANWAAGQLISSLPQMDEKKASEMIAHYFPQVRPTVEKMWLELAEEMKKKAELKKAVTV